MLFFKDDISLVFCNRNKANGIKRIVAGKTHGRGGTNFCIPKIQRGAEKTSFGHVQEFTTRKRIHATLTNKRTAVVNAAPHSKIRLDEFHEFMFSLFLSGSFVG